MPEDRDRYSGNPLDGSYAMAERLDAIERRLAQLEGAAPAGVDRLRIRSSTDPTLPVFEVGGEGTLQPWLAYPMVDANLNATVSSGTFASLWKATIDLVSHKALLLTVPFTTAVGTSVELRVKAGIATAPLETVTVGSFAFLYWEHGTPPGTGPVVVSVEARVSAGASTGHIYTPVVTFRGRAVDATASAIWWTT